MKAAIKGAAARFSARRMGKEYVSKFYSNALRDLHESEDPVRLP
jgi:hypothetical protein